MIGMPWIAAAAILALLLGVLLALVGVGMRRRRGLGGGQTVSLDKVTLTSLRYGLVGRPDRLIRTGRRMVIPEEWKSSHSLRPWHRAQMGVYFLLIEDQLRIKPPHGFIVCGDGSRHRIENDDALRSVVLDLAARIRAARLEVERPIPVSPKPWQCPPCGMRSHCGQARL